MRLRNIIKYGNTYVIKLHTADIEDFGLVIGDKVDIDDLVLLQEKISSKKRRGSKNT
jgi:hypothetical protein